MLEVLLPPPRLPCLRIDGGAIGIVWWPLRVEEGGTTRAGESKRERCRQCGRQAAVGSAEPTRGTGVTRVRVGALDRRGRIAIWVTIAVTGFAVLCPFLVGALSVVMQDEFDLDSSDIGLAVGAFFAVSGSTAQMAGRIVARIGTRRSIVVAALVGATGLLVIATAETWWVVVAGLVIGGSAAASVHPATAQLLAATVRGRHLGLAFGVKQAGGPASTLLAGLAIPTLALWVGWRLTFVVAAAFISVLGLVAARVVGGLEADPSPPEEDVELEAPPMRLRLLAVGSLLGTAGGNSLGAMLADSGTRYADLGEATIGFTIAGLSIATLAMRVGSGWAADAGRLDTDRMLRGMPALGMIGAALLAVPTQATFFVGAALAFSFGWGWGGLLHYRVIAPQRGHAARLTAVLMTGFALGAATGPVLIGFVADVATYRVAWLVASLLFGLTWVSLYYGLPRSAPRSL